MKKSTMIALVSYLNGQNVTNLDEIKAELEAELNRNAVRAAQNRERYEDAKAVVLRTLRLTNSPVTVAELMEACEDELPEGFTRGKVQYGLNNYWTDVVVKVENPNGANMYRAK